MRVGIGWDVHKLGKGRKLVLGGIEVPFKLGLVGYSDADVLTHAVIDALLGATGLGDIGTHFPAGDKRFKDISSMKLLARVLAMIKKRGWEIVNIDSTVIAEKPVLGPYVFMMAKKLARAAGIPSDRVNVKAKTEEKLGYIGKGEAISAQAVCLIKEKD